jgi:hypothetical protein
MTMLKLPFFTELEGARRVLLAGAGGGYDLFCGLPLYHGLRDAGDHVFLANLSFTHLGAVRGRRPAPAVLEVTADSEGPGFINYFPEGYHATERTAGSTLWINPLMTLYWCFRLDPVARRILYLEAMKQTQTYTDVQQVILEFRARCPSVRPWQDMPV